MRKKYYLSACCILKDEDPFIMEWLTYHSLIGVEHFFVYDNESANPLAQNPLIRKFSDQGKLTLLDTPGQVMQFPSYNHCRQTFGQLSKWIAFIDLDEFICPLEGRDLRPLLAGYEDYAALGLSWKCFSSGGHLSSPRGLVIRNYLERFQRYTDKNLHIKSIIQPDKNNSLSTPHAFWPNEGELAVSASYRPITQGNSMIPICWEKAVVNHYMLKSQEDAQRRMIRGRADIKSDRPTLDNEDFRRLANEPVEFDDNITCFADETQRWMDVGELPEEHASSLAGRDAEELLELAGRLMRQKLLREAGIVLCHAALGQSESAPLWQLRARLAALQGQEDLAGLFAEKAARVRAGLPASPYPKALSPEKFTKKEAASITTEVKNLMAAHEDSKAIALLDNLPADHRLGVDMLLLRGELARRGKDLSRAEECFTAALGLEEHLNTYLCLIQLRLDQKNHADALELVFYFLYTGSYRVPDESFYEPLKKVYGDLKRLLGKF